MAWIEPELKCVSFMTPLSQFMTSTFQNSLPRHFFWGRNSDSITHCINWLWLKPAWRRHQQAKKKASLMIVLNCHFALLILAMRHTHGKHYSSSFEIIRGCEEINDSFYAYQMNTLKDRILLAPNFSYFNWMFKWLQVCAAAPLSAKNVSKLTIAN